MNTHHATTSAEPFQFHVNLADDWERRYLAARLGVSEEALRAVARGDDATIEQIFERFCPAHREPSLHTRLHQEAVADGTR